MVETRGLAASTLKPVLAGVEQTLTTEEKAQARTNIGAPEDTDDLPEGVTNLYYTNARADARVAAGKRQSPVLLSMLDSLLAGQSQTWAIMSDSTGVYDSNERLFYRSARMISALLGSAVRVEFMQFDVSGQNVYGAPTVIQAGTNGERRLQFDGTSNTRSAQLSPTTVGEVPTPAAWAGDTVYAVGAYVLNDSGKLYRATARGTSAASGGPTGLGSAIADGSVIWTYVVSSIDRQWEFRIAPATVSGAIECIMAHQGGPGSRGWQIRKLANGDIAVTWHPDPTSETSQTFTITAANLGIVAGVMVDYKVVLDADNGASGYTITAYKSTNNRASWTQIQTATVAGVTSVGVPTAVLTYYEVGARSNSLEPFNGEIARAQYRIGIDGALMFPPLIEQWGTSTAGSAVLLGSPTLQIFNGAVAGKSLSYFLGLTGDYPGGTTTSDGTDRFRKLLPPNITGLVSVNTDHNEGIFTNREIMTAMDTFAAAVRARAPSAPLAVSVQNPEAPGTTATSAQVRQRHAARAILMKDWALARGHVIFDTYRHFFTNGVLDTSLIAADGVHPIEPAGYIAGSRGITEAWGVPPATT